MTKKKIFLNKEELEREYLTNEKGSDLIAKEQNVSPSCVLRRLKKHNIKIRDRHEQTKNSIKYYGHPLKGKHHSEETKRKIGEKHKGMKQSEETKLKHSLSTKGIPHSKEHNLKVSLGLKGKKRSEEHTKHLKESAERRLKGKTLEEIYGERAKKIREKLSKKLSLENNPAWKGGLSFEPYDKQFNNKFKELIKIRDNDSCVICGFNNVIIHHIDYNKLNSKKDNCVCLCPSCHSKTNFNRDAWTKFFQLLLNKNYGYELK